MEKKIIVSVVIPIRNEEKHVEKCILSILAQDYPLESMEIIFVDGMSSDNTKGIINHYLEKYPLLIRLMNNPHRTVPYAMNIGIENSVGNYIVRLDAHSEYADDYISRCIETLEATGADNAGGLAITKGRGFIGEAFANVLSSKFGVGNSGFRTNASSGFVDTVPFGTFKRDTFHKYGFYDVRLTRNQDYELNYRIRNMGGKIFLDSGIKLTYYCRNTLTGILKQSYENGRWNVITSKLCPGSMGVRHFVPLAFLVSIMILPIISLAIPMFWWLFALDIGLYLMLNIMFSVKAATELKQIPVLMVLFPIFHLSYGYGSLTGITSKC